MRESFTLNSRWLIMGPRRSGSTFHVDPNSTSAWNAVVSGAKKWIMYPPHVCPPGVHPSPDGADVATPLSLTEWFLNFYEEAQEGKVRRALSFAFSLSSFLSLVFSLFDQSVAFLLNANRLLCRSSPSSAS
jgi:hypothetical protein